MSNVDTPQLPLPSPPDLHLFLVEMGIDAGAPMSFGTAHARRSEQGLKTTPEHSTASVIKAATSNLETKHGARPQMRVGLNTGSAVVGKVEDGADARVTARRQGKLRSAPAGSCRSGFSADERCDAPSPWDGKKRKLQSASV